MKKILSLIILFFFINNCSESYNKSRLKMNGVSLEDSLLYYLDEKQIKTLQTDWIYSKKTDKIKTIILDRDKMDVKKPTELIYDIFKNPEVDFKNDPSYKILAIRGMFSCEEMQKCLELFNFLLSQETKRLRGAKRFDEEDQTGIPGKISKVRTFILKDDTSIKFWLFNIPGDKELNKVYLMKTIVSDEIREYTK
jgi:hypothetical protein